MEISEEHEYLLASVKRWFDKADQIKHYTEELAMGVTPAEGYLLGQIPDDGTVLDVGCGAGRISLNSWRTRV